MTSNITQFENALLSMDRIAANAVFESGGSSGNPIAFIESIVVPALNSIGEAWERGDAALSQVYMSGIICEELIDGILPPGAPQRTDQPPMAIAVLEDYHMLGKRIVYSLLRSAGFELGDYGPVQADELVERAIGDAIHVLLISTLMMPSALKIAAVRDGFASAGKDVKIIVGGAPFNFDPKLWEEVGADAMCRNASEAIGTVNRVMRGA